MENVEQILKDLDKAHRLKEQKEFYKFFDTDVTSKDYPGVIGDIWCYAGDPVAAIAKIFIPIEENFEPEQVLNSFWDKIIPSRKRKVEEIKKRNEQTQAKYAQYKVRAEKIWNEISNSVIEEVSPVARLKIKEADDFWEAHPEFHTPELYQKYYNSSLDLENIYYEVKYNGDKYESVKDVIKQLGREAENEYYREKKREIDAARIKEIEEEQERNKIDGVLYVEKNYDSTRCLGCKYRNYCDRKRCNFFPGDPV